MTNPRAIGSKDWERDYRRSYDLATNEVTSDERLLELIARLHELRGEALRRWLDAHFEIENFLRTLAMNVLLGMPDDYWAMGNTTISTSVRSARSSSPGTTITASAAAGAPSPPGATRASRPPTSSPGRT